MLLTCSFILAQETHTVTLYVDTDNITKNTIAENANFGQNVGTTNEDFTIEVNKGDNIEWVGVSTSDTGEVHIKKIKYKKGNKLLQRDENDGEKTVKAKVDKGNKGDVEEYDISFKIVSSVNNQNRVFRIDPKIRIKSQD